MFLFHPPTRNNTHLKRSSKFTLLLSTTQIIGKSTIVWLCANWLIQLRSGAVIGSRVIYCQSDPRSLFRRRAKTTLLLLNMPLDWRTIRAAGNEIKWKNSLRCYRHWVNASYFAAADFIFFPGNAKYIRVRRASHEIILWSWAHAFVGFRELTRIMLCTARGRKRQHFKHFLLISLSPNLKSSRNFTPHRSVGRSRFVSYHNKRIHITSYRNFKLDLLNKVLQSLG